MSAEVPVCRMGPELSSELKKFRFNRSRNGRALIMKIDADRMEVVVDELMEDITTEQLRDELPERQPRFAAYSFEMHHDDGRLSYPLCLIFSTPRGCKTELLVMYAGTKLSLIKESEITKVYEVQDLEELTTEWLEEKLR